MHNSIFRISVVFITVAALLALAACSHGSDGDDESPRAQTHTVTFYANGGTFQGGAGETVLSVADGSAVKAPAVTPPKDHALAAWSKAQGSLRAYDFATPVTSDLAFFALYVPKVERLAAKNGFLTATFAADSPVIVRDAALYTATWTRTGASGEEASGTLSLSLATADDSADSAETGAGNALSFSFEPFSYPADSSVTYTVTLSAGSGGNGYEASAIFAVSPPETPQNLGGYLSDSLLHIEWDAQDGVASYEVSLFEGNAATGEPVAVRTVSKTEVDFCALTNDQAYTISIVPAGTTNAATITATPRIIKEECDWLIIMYLDGDNDLNDPIYIDLNEAEYGLSQIQDEDGNALDGYDTVRVVALWDGYAGSSTVSTRYGSPHSYLYLLGADTNNPADGAVALGTATENLTFMAPWLLKTDESNLTDGNIDINKVTRDSYGEADMSSGDTLLNLLNWANAHFDAQCTILQFSDHGGGPRSPSDGYGRRALAWDEASGSSFLTTEALADALDHAGYGLADNARWLSIILMDVCLGSSIEDARTFADYAHYFVASPNTIGKDGLDYAALIRSFTTDSTSESVARQVVADFTAHYTPSDDFWRQLGRKLGYSGSELSDADNLKTVAWYSMGEIPTITLIDLGKMYALSDKFSVLTNAIVTNEEAVAALKPYIAFYDHYSKEFFNSLCYKGEFAWLHDLGLFTQKAAAVALEHGWTDIATYADELLSALDAAIMESWRAAPAALSASGNLYDSLYKSGDSRAYLGMTISGATVVKSGSDYYDGTAPAFYRTALPFFASDNAWVDLLEAWF